MKLNNTIKNPYGLNAIGTLEYKAYINDVRLYRGNPWIDGIKAALVWAKAAQENYARDPEEFILTGLVDGRTREEDIQSYFAFCEAEEDEYGDLIY